MAVNIVILRVSNQENDNREANAFPTRPDVTSRITTRADKAAGLVRNWVPLDWYCLFFSWNLTPHCWTLQFFLHGSCRAGRQFSLHGSYRAGRQISLHGRYRESRQVDRYFSLHGSYRAGRQFSLHGHYREGLQVFLSPRELQIKQTALSPRKLKSRQAVLSPRELQSRQAFLSLRALQSR
jgi:hypothetical protein